MTLGAPNRSPYRTLLALPNFRRLFLAGIGSVTGGAITGLCLVWMVFTATGSALDVGFVGAAGLAAGVAFSLIGGTLVDRHDRRRLMVVSDLVRAAATAALVLFTWRFGVNLPAIVLDTFVVGSFTTIFNPAEQSLIPAIVEAGHTADANGLISASRSSAQLVGTALAGALIVSVGPLVGLGINALTFLVSGLLVAGVRVPSALRNPSVARGARAFRAEIREGFAWLWGNQGLFQLTVSAGFFNFFSTMVGGFLVVYATVALHGSALLFASMLALMTAGQAISSLAVGRTGAVRRAGRVWVLAYGIASAIAAVALGFLPNDTIALAASFSLGFFGGFAGTTWLTGAQLTVPPEMQGRYFGIDGLGSWAILPAAQVGGGVLIGLYGVLPTYRVAGVLWLAIGLAFLLPRSLARWAYPPAPEPGRDVGGVDRGDRGAAHHNLLP